MKYVHLYALTIFVTLQSPSVILVQESDKVGSEVTDSSAVFTDTEIQTRLTLARQLIATRNYEGAVAILEVIFEDRPTDQNVQNLLLNCYTQMQQYARAEVLIRRQIEQQPRNYLFNMKLAEVLARQGDLEASLVEYDKALSLMGTRNTNRYLVVIRSLISHGLEDRALVMIDSVRVLESDTLLYVVERGSILESKKKYSAAADEYIHLLTLDTTAQGHNAERKLLALLEFAESSGEAEQALLFALDQNNSSRLLELLVVHYLKAERFDEAFGMALKQDSLDRGNGVALLRYMKQCSDHRAYSQVVRMGDQMLQQYPDGPLTHDLLLLYSEGLAGTGRSREAIEALQRLVAALPNSAAAAEAYYRIGSLYYEDVNDPVSALACFDSVLMMPPGEFSYLGALKNIPHCYVRLGRLEDARAGFMNLRAMKVNEEIAEEMDYNLAMIKLYQKQYDSSEVALRRLMVDYPRGFFVNDALQLIMLITGVKESEELLYDYSNALYFEERLMYDSARVRLESLSRAEGRVAADVALFRLAELEFKYHDTLAALEIITRLVEEFPESYYMPHCLKARADILILDAATREEGIALYTQLLKEYPNYPFVSDVRRRLRELEHDRNIG